jgi:lactate dehydrogenase-like 2-hydroxyacid dehydrogenase
MNNEENLQLHNLGWIGTGRMGFAMAKRLLEADCDVTVYNRTRAKTEPLASHGGLLMRQQSLPIAMSSSPWYPARTTCTALSVGIAAC